MREDFDELKMKLTSTSVLEFPDLEQQFIVGTNAWSVAAGAVLSEKEEDDNLYPIW